MCSSPHWQVGQSPGRSWFREKLSPANGNKGYIAVSRFREKMFAANWVQRVTAISRKISRSWAPKNGVQHATAIYPIPRYTRPRYIGLILYLHNKSSYALDLIYVNSSSPPGAAYMRQWIRSALVQIMAWRRISEPMLGYCQLHL